MNSFVEGGFEKYLGVITAAALGFEDHGILTASITLDYGGMSQTVGGFAMSVSANHPPDEWANATPLAADFIIGVLNAVGVERWDQLVGRHVLAIWRERFRLNTMPDGLEPLATQRRGRRFIFAEWQERSRAYRACPERMTRAQATEIAVDAARAKPESYFVEPFTPHQWVVDAILKAANR